MSGPGPGTTPGAEAELPATCPSCGAAVRQSVPWCLQCYADLRPQSAQEPDPGRDQGPEPEPAQGPSSLTTGHEGAPVVGERRRGRHAADVDDDVPVGRDLGAAQIDALADRMLAELAGEVAGEGTRRPAWAARMTASRGTKVAWTLAIVAGLGLALLLALTVLGHLL